MFIQALSVGFAAVRLLQIGMQIGVHTVSYKVCQYEGVNSK